MSKHTFKITNVEDAIETLQIIEARVQKRFPTDLSTSDFFQKNVANVVALYNAKIQADALEQIATTNPMAG